MATSDEELRRRLKQFGVEMGPITNTTRELYRKLLDKKTRTADRRMPAPSNNRPIHPTHKNTPSKPNLSKLTPKSHIPVPSPSSQGISLSAKRPASSHGNNQAFSKRPRLERNFSEEEKEMKMSQGPSKPLAASSPKHKRLYPTLPQDVGREYIDLDDSDPQSSLKTPSPAANVSLSPPSPSLNTSQGGGLGGWLTGIVGGVKKFVNQIASPRKSSLSSSRVSQSDESPGPSQGPLLLDSFQVNEESPTLQLRPSPHTPEKERQERYDWELLPTDVEICKKPNGSLWLLGKGGFGEVFKGLKDSVDEVAVKVIRIKSSHNAIVQFQQEIDIISKLRHRHILQFYGACIQPSCLYMVTELMQTDLFSALRNKVRAKYLWTGVYGKEVLVGVASGLHYLHSLRPPIVHRDIKSPNILLMDGMAKIADVGIARSKSDSDMTAQNGFSIAWASPEVVYKRRATEKIDIWSFGVIIWEVSTGKMPSVGQLVLSNEAPAALRSLYTACVEEDPIRRPSAAQTIRQLKAINN